MDLKINPEYELLLPKLSNEKYKSLKKSIKDEGLWHPITVNFQGIILDGHTRYHICVELGIETKCLHGEPYEIMDFSDPLLEKKFVIESNLDRRNLNDFQMVELGLPLLAIYEDIAKKRQGRRTDLVEHSLNSEVMLKKRHERESASIIAGMADVSYGTCVRAKVILEYGSEALKQACREERENRQFYECV